MDSVEKALVLGLKIPTASALYGAKITLPSPAVAAPANFQSIVRDPVDTEEKALVLGSKIPTASAVRTADLRVTRALQHKYQHKPSLVVCSARSSRCAWSH